MINMATSRNVAILLFNDVELLDFCGPYEVFSIAGRRDGSNPFNVYSVAEYPGPVTASNHVSINPHYDFSCCPASDIIIIPGGMGSRREMNNPVVLDWVKARAKKAQLVLSVCTGALILARAGLLEGLAATTHHNAIKLLREIAPNTIVYEDRRVVDNGKIILSAGISAGIDMSFHVVSKLLGEKYAIEAAYHMEYDWKPEH
jgi:transcriptional regulator GlxA family with amidase domain